MLKNNTDQRRSILEILLLFLDAPADAEYMSVGVTNVHFANVPLHVCWRPRHVETLVETPLVDGVDVIYPDRHPNAPFRFVGTIRAKRHFSVAPSAAALAI